jgi:hypothetical protein
MFNSADGQLLSVYYYGDYYSSEWMKRMLLVSSLTPSRKIYVCKRHIVTGFTGYHLLRLTDAVGQTSPNWAFKSSF